MKKTILVIDPLSNTALNPILEEAVDAGILVIVSDQPVTSKEVWQVMPTRDVWMEKPARYVFKRMDGKGKLVYLGGIDGAPASDQRDEGFYRALKDYPNIELLTHTFGFWDPSRSQQAMTDVLAAYPRIDGVVAQDGVCLATTRAFQAAGRKLPVINGEGFRPFLEYCVENLDKGFTSYAIANGPGFAMTCSLGVGVRMLQGKKIRPELLKGKVLNLDHTNIITDQNVREQLSEHVRLRSVYAFLQSRERAKTFRRRRRAPGGEFRFRGGEGVRARRGERLGKDRLREDLLRGHPGRRGTILHRRPPGRNTLACGRQAARIRSRPPEPFAHSGPDRAAEHLPGARKKAEPAFPGRQIRTARRGGDPGRPSSFGDPPGSQGIVSEPGPPADSRGGKSPFPEAPRTDPRRADRGDRVHPRGAAFQKDRAAQTRGNLGGVHSPQALGDHPDMRSGHRLPKRGDGRHRRLRAAAPGRGPDRASRHRPGEGGADRFREKNREALRRCGNGARAVRAGNLRHPSFTSFLVMLVLLVVNAVLQPKFFSYRAIKSNFSAFTPLILASMAQGIIIISGSLDLSLGTAISLFSVCTAYIMTDGNVLPVIALGALIVVSASVFIAMAALCVLMITATGEWRNGLGYNLNTIAAVVIGGIALTGGKGSVLGAIFGALALGMPNNVLFFAKLSSYRQVFFKRLIIVVSLSLGAVPTRVKSRRKT